MKNNPISSILSIYLILIASCSVKHAEGPAKVLRLTGINDTANYHISHNTGEVLTVMKDEYTQLTEYYIQINKDTVMLGNKFIASFFVIKPKFKISIEEPRAEVIEGAFKGPDPETKDASKDLHNFVFPTETIGMFRLKGKLEYDSLVVPFEYRFIVIAKQ